MQTVQSINLIVYACKIKTRSNDMDHGYLTQKFWFYAQI